MDTINSTFIDDILSLNISHFNNTVLSEHLQISAPNNHHQSTTGNTITTGQNELADIRNKTIDDHVLKSALDFIQIFYIYYTPTICLAGAIGNVLSVLVFFRTRLKKLSSSWYLAGLGVSDTCFLLIAFINWSTVIDIDWANRNVICQLITYFGHVCSFLSVWFVVAFTFERFIAVLYPLKRQTMCTVRRAKIIVSVLLLTGSIHCLPVLMFSAPIHVEGRDKPECLMRKEYKFYSNIMNNIDTVVVFLVPLTSIIILNAFTGFTVWRVAGVRRTMTIHKRKNIQSRNSNSLTVPRCTHPNGHHSIKQSCPKTSRRGPNSSQMKVTKMLLIVSSVFVCLNLPSYVMRIVGFMQDDEQVNWTPLFQYYSYLIFLLSFGINFFLYCVSGQNFRKAVISMFKGTPKRQDGATQVTECIRSSGSNASRRRTITNHGYSNSWNDIPDETIIMMRTLTK